jgi:hypothetical protein
LATGLLPLRTLPRRDVFLGLAHRHAIEKARIDHAPVVIGNIGDDLLAASCPSGQTTGMLPIFVDEIEVALIVRGSRKSRRCRIPSK